MTQKGGGGEKENKDIVYLKRKGGLSEGKDTLTVFTQNLNLHTPTKQKKSLQEVIGKITQGNAELEESFSSQWVVYLKYQYS